MTMTTSAAGLGRTVARPHVRAWPNVPRCRRPPREAGKFPRLCARTREDLLALGQSRLPAGTRPTGWPLSPGCATNSVFGFIRASILLAALAASAGTPSAGYDAATCGAYVWLSPGAARHGQAVRAAAEIGDRVRTGDIAVDFLRPVDPQLAYLAGDLGRAA